MFSEIMYPWCLGELRLRRVFSLGLVSVALCLAFSPYCPAGAVASISAPPSTGAIHPAESDHCPPATAPSDVATDGSSGVVLLYFMQKECPPCRQMQPMLEHLIDRGFPLQVIDAQANSNLVQQFKVQSTPTFVLLKDGEELKRQSGVLSSYQINSLLIDAGHSTDQDVLTKPNALSPIVNFFDRLRPANRFAGRGKGTNPGKPTTTDPTATIDWADLTDVERKALQATGRLKIEYQDRGQKVTDYGTATVIHRQGNDILLLTCGHVFRDSQGQGEIRVELDFSQGQPQETVRGRLLMFDAGAPDVALVAATTRLPIEPVPLSRADYRPAAGTPAFSVGCDHGAPATVRRGEHLTMVRCGAVQIPGQPNDERMAQKYAVRGRPVVGRSGGGLFTADGALIGVCNAAVVENNEGRYSAIDNIHTMLGQANLIQIVTQPPAEFLASNVAMVAATRTSEASVRPARPRFIPLLESEPTEIARWNGSPTPPPARANQSLGQSIR
jgi:thiol-disulfide isomerase/thioredoxin